jgi:hypothetical protein
MGRKQIEQDLRDAGLRKKRARRMAKAAERARAGDRTARDLVEQQSAALRDSASAVVSHAKPPTSTKKASAKKSSSKRTATKRATGGRSTSKASTRRRRRSAR